MTGSTDRTDIEIEDLRVRFGDRTVIDGLSLSLGAGERVTLTGPSGSGKSSVLRAILGFVAPSGGFVRVRGQEVTGKTAWPLRRHLAFVMQESDLGNGRVRDCIELPFGYGANAELRDNLRRVPELCDRFLLPASLLDESIETLSGGEKQRVAIIRAVLLDRPIVLLDEASSALDPDSRAAVAEHFRNDEGRTVLSVAHDPDRFAIGGGVVALTGA
jgi:putative ABC transport system ATP-binding protein